MENTNLKDSRQHNKEIVEARKQEQMFATAGGQLAKSSPSPRLDNNVGANCQNSTGKVSPSLIFRSRDSPSFKQSPSKSPAYVRKPLPVHEPKPMLPKSKQIKLESGSSSSLAIIRASVIEEENSSGDSIEKQQSSKLLEKGHIETGDYDKAISLPLESLEPLEETPTRASILSKKSCPLSPRLATRNRPSTLMLDKKERFKRSSAVSATPSTDSSKSSKTFDFLDYDEETKEKVLEEAIKEEEAFLEFVKTLNIEPDPIIEAGNVRDHKQVNVIKEKNFF